MEIKLVSKITDYFKIFLFVVAFVLNSMNSEGSSIVIIQWTMVAAQLWLLVVYLMSILKQYSYRKIVRFTVSGLEFSLLILALVTYQIDEKFNSIQFLWFLPMILRWYLPRIFCYFSKKGKRLSVF